jgi:protein TonB
VPAPPTELDSLLTIAAARLARGQLVEPAGDSALAYLQRALEIDSTDARVAAQRAQLGAALIAAARNAADGGDLDRATALVTSADNLGAAADSIAAVGTAIERLRSERTRQRHVQIAATVRERLESDALLAPTGDSAIDHLGTLQAEGATLEELPELWDALTSALTAKARSAMARRDWPGAAAWVAALKRTGRDVAFAGELERQVTFGRLQEQYLATVAPASELSLLFNPPVEYPRDLEVRGIEGWVDVQFVVDRMGNVRDAVVVAAQPPRRFEEAALAAVARYRYAPFTLDGQTYERLLQLRIRFELQ